MTKTPPQQARANKMQKFSESLVGHGESEEVGYSEELIFMKTTETVEVQTVLTGDELDFYMDTA